MASLNILNLIAPCNKRIQGYMSASKLWPRANCYQVNATDVRSLKMEEVEDEYLLRFRTKHL